MQGISWSKELKLGIKPIDANHRKLISIANEFINAASQRSKTATLVRLLTKLRESAVSHINNQERFMATVRYHRRARHSLANQRFKVAMQRFQHHIQVAGGVNVNDVQYFKKSLINHIKDSKQAMEKSVMALNSPGLSTIH